MRILRGIYEGPGSHGVLRVVASMREVHAVLRGAPGESYFPAFHSARERDGKPSPVTLSPLWKRPEDTNSPGDLPRDLSNIVRRHPEARAIVLTRSETALLSGEDVPEVSLPRSPKTGKSPAFAPCAWESPAILETEAAELVLEDLVREYAVAPEEQPERPSVNVFGPPVFGPGAAAEYAEAERLLGLLGVEVNARVPLGAGPDELSRLARARANVLIYREVGESATLYLQDKFGMPRVTTPMIGTAGTGAALRAIGRACGLDGNRVRRISWGELSRTAKLPWLARLAPPEVFEGRAFIFGDFTYALGLGYALSREVGLEVASCGTYMKHLGRDFVFHAETFSDDVFVDDDPEEVAARIEGSNPDLVIGTHLEEAVADSLGIPFLPFCPPTVEHPFAQRPLMGYTGSSLLADALDNSLRRIQKPVQEPRETGIPWTEEATEELSEIPAFLRGRAKRLAEDRARETDSPEVTREIFLASRL